MNNIVIIGAGITGASTAYELAKRGANVTIIDRNDIGQATEAAAGIICPWLAQRRNKAWYQLVNNGAHYYPHLIKELNEIGEHETGYQVVGCLGLHLEEKKLEAAYERVLKRKEDGAPQIGLITIFNEEETKKHFPLAEGQFRSIYISGAARVNGKDIKDALLRGAKHYGATLIQGGASFIFEHEKVKGIKVNGTMFEPDVTIATNGAWMAELFSPLNISFNTYPQKAQIIHLELPNHKTNNWPVIMPPNNQYMLPFGDNQMIIGATHETEAGFDPRITMGGVHEVLSKALDIAPALSSSTYKTTKVGYRPFVKGSFPVLGKVPGFDNIYIANGLGASGLTAGPYIGSELAKLVLGEPLTINLEDYDVQKAINVD